MSTIVVFPASGWQGRSVCEALAKDYNVVAVVRNLDSPKLNLGGINLRELNVKLVQGDFNNPASYRQHLQGAHGVFVNTDYWSIYADNGGKSAEAIATELKYGKDVIDEAKAAGVKHFVFSSLFKACDTTPDMYPEASYQLEDYLAQSGVPHSIYYSSGYWENLQHFDMCKPQPDGSVLVNLMCPDAVKQEFTSINTVGRFVKEIFDHRGKYLGKQVLNTSEEATWGDFATRLAKISGKKVITPNISDEVWESDGMKQAMGSFHQIFDALYKTYRKAYFPGTTGREVIPDLPTFEEWAKNDGYIKSVFEI